jgi:predicted CoA-substrate-specific enzyme activase
MITMGIDIGSTACKCILLEDGRTIVARVVIPFGAGTIGPQQAYDAALMQRSIERSDVARIMVTGYGRFSFPEADTQKSELSCHAKGIHHLLPSVRTIVDIGGQDAKALRLNPKGQLENFVMNDKCAAGTGKFLEVMAGRLNVNTEDLGAIDAEATEEASISSTCTVFAESEVISKLATNVKKADLVAGIHRSVAKRVAVLAFRNGVVKDVAMSGGVALNKGVVRALGQELKAEILVHADCQLAGALGAALFAWEELQQNG